mgnify:FL=1|jgi:hypothetical protein|tara:strand:+ start:419 stop:874 length:456 start_codon:yes stop_codon:yes gene_type:complete
MRDREYIEVLFVSLNPPNGFHKKRLWRDVESFFHKLKAYTGVHLRVLRGYEAEGNNSHEHAIVLVSKDELERWNKRFPTFKPWKAWNWDHYIKPFDQNQKDEAYQYVLVKHQPVMPNESQEYYCPQRYSRCRSGKCLHIPAPAPAGTDIQP